MKSLKLLVAIALPLSALTTIFLSTPALSDQYDQTTARTCGRYGHGGRLWTQDDGAPINIRDGASVQAYARHIGYKGDLVELVQDTQGSDNYCWYKVKFVHSGAIGWVRGDFIKILPED